MNTDGIMNKLENSPAGNEIFAPAPAAPTPLTDAEEALVQEFSDHWKEKLVRSNFARDLERKLAEARAQGQKPAQAVDRED